jgi:hypothetical protein
MTLITALYPDNTFCEVDDEGKVDDGGKKIEGLKTPNMDFASQNNDVNVIGSDDVNAPLDIPTMNFGKPSAKQTNQNTSNENTETLAIPTMNFDK